ncbi:hypothetical protein [Intestinibacter sp.]
MYNIGSGIVYKDILGFIPVEVLPSSPTLVVIKLLTEYVSLELSHKYDS